MKLKEIFNIADGLSDIHHKELNVSAAYKVQYNFEKVKDEVKTANEVRKKIIDKYKEGEENGQIKIKEGKEDAFNKEVTELMEQDVNIELKQITLNELGNIKIRPSILNKMNSIIKEEE